MKEKLSHQVRKDVFEQCGVKWGKRKSTHNIHHIIFKKDVKHGDAPRDFLVNARFNLIVLPIPVHKELHDLVERTPAYRNCIESRIWLANYAYNGELDLL
jgi:hypothetical protein